MPPFPGEERLVTLFTDCHYYFAQPTARPVLHRFDKASYFYIYWNATRQTSRIEVANNPGTPDQDAFNGQLDTCRVINSYKFPTLVTLIVDAVDPSSPISSRAGRDPEEWKLSSADPKSMTQTKYRLHTIDFYFWTQEDAKLVTDRFRKLLNPNQLDLAEPKPQQQQQDRHSQDVGISPVVQNLEKVAISDPAYSNGQTRNSQNQPQSQAMSVPPPPPPPPPPMSQPRAESASAMSPSAVSPSPLSQSSNVGGGPSAQAASSSIDYTPMAYNPAAPAAPEKIAHREKTPPPEEEAQGPGLVSPAMHGHTSNQGYTPSQSWGAPPTASQVSQSSHWGSPPPQTSTPGYGSQGPTSVGYASQSPSGHYQQGRASATSAGSGIPSFAPPPANPPPTQDSHRHSTAAETYTPDMHSSQNQVAESPGSQFYSTIQQPEKPLQHVQPQYADYLSGGAKPGSLPGPPQPPPGGWADYSYAQNPQSQHTSAHGDYNVHNQVYRPTESEANAHSRHSRPSRVDTYLAGTKKDSVAGKTLNFLKRQKDKAERF